MKVGFIKKRLIRCIIILMSFLLFGLIAGYFYLQNANYHSALSTAKDWAQLNDFPTTTTNLTVDIEGSIFSREITIQFDAPIEDIKDWLNESPGTKDIEPIINGSTHKYSIQPSGGAQHAEVILDVETEHVWINTYWS